MKIETSFFMNRPHTFKGQFVVEYCLIALCLWIPLWVVSTYSQKGFIPTVIDSIDSAEEKTKQKLFLPFTQQTFSERKKNETNTPIQKK